MVNDVKEDSVYRTVRDISTLNWNHETFKKGSWREEKRKRREMKSYFENQLEIFQLDRLLKRDIKLMESQSSSLIQYEYVTV